MRDEDGDTKVWQSLYNADPGELWETHSDLKNRLLDFVRRRVGRQVRRRNEPDDVCEAARTVLDPNALTIGFARRFATYKRADLFFRLLDELADLVNDPQRPVQLIFSGKAHPADEPGKYLIKKIENLRHDRRFVGRIVFIEDYDINVARHLVQGVDVWLNTPAPAEGSLGHQRHEGRAQRRLESFDPRWLVGRSLQRQERLRDRRRPAARG